MGLCVHTVRAYAPILYGAMSPYGADYAPVFYGFKGLSPPEAFVLTSTRYVPATSSEGIYHHAPGGLVFGDDRSSDSRSRFLNKEDALRLVFLVELQAASRKLHNTAAGEKLIESLELNSYGVHRADGHFYL